MSNAASFNLLKFVERNPVLNATRLISIIVFFIVFLLTYFFFQVYQFRHGSEKIATLEQTIAQDVQLIQPILQQGAGNLLMGVLPTNLINYENDFYPEFEALSHVRVKGLWLTEVVINRNPPFIKISGAMDSSDKLNSLLQQLAAQPVFKSVKFIGVNVDKGLLADIPAKYQEEVKQLKLPVFYHFVIQTMPLTRQEARS